MSHISLLKIFSTRQQ